MDELIFRSARELAQAIHQKQVSSVEVVEAHLAQIAQHNPALNAIVTLDEEGARSRAEAADNALTQGEVWGPLHGVPITLEDVHPTAGMRSTWGGNPSLADHIPTEDSPVAARLKAAGAIVLGKTNGPTIWGDDSLFSRTNNPWDLERTPGGSSSGPATALAAGLTPLDIGLDTLGSIEQPAHYCGILGMRPTEHRVPLTSIFYPRGIREFRIMTVIGPMARSVEDLRLALQIIAGPDERDAHVPPVPWREVPRPALRDLRIAWSSTIPGVPIASDICAAIERLAQELNRLGDQVEQRLPDMDFEKQAQLGLRLFGLIANTFESRPEDTPPPTLEDYLMALHKRDSFIATWEQFFTDWDVLVCPVGLITAWLHTERDKPATVDGELLSDEQDQLLRIPYLFSPVSGCPTVVIPLAKDRNGLPIGVQAMARRWDDERLLTIAELLSEVTGGFERPPGY